MLVIGLSKSHKFYQVCQTGLLTTANGVSFQALPSGFTAIALRIVNFFPHGRYVQAVPGHCLLYILQRCSPAVQGMESPQSFPVK